VVRGVRHTNSDLLMKGVVKNSVHLRVPIDRLVNFINKIRILLVTTFEHMVPIGICRKKLGVFIYGDPWDCASSMRL